MVYLNVFVLLENQFQINDFFRNGNLAVDYLENLPKISKFDLVISCLMVKEKEGFFDFF